MGVFTLCVSVMLVVLQATVILLGRPESAWTLSLVRATVVVGTGNGTAATATARTVLPPWNPHLLLLALCGIQAIVALARRQAPAHAPIDEDAMGVDNVPLGLTACALLAVLVSCIVVHAIRDTALVQYPTMLALLALILAAVFYMWQHAAFWRLDAAAANNTKEKEEEDVSGFWAWALAFHMQAVGVPLAGLALALFGSRQWSDLAAVFLLLSAAVNLVWLHLLLLRRRRRGGGSSSILLGALMIAVLVSFCLYIGHVQFGPDDTWCYVLTLMASADLAVPAYLVCIAVPADGDGVRERGYHSLSLMACNAALLSLVVVLSQLAQ